MNITIFGASGLTGHELVYQALQQGHHVKAFVRNPSKLQVKHDNFLLFKGEILDYSAVVTAIKGQDAVFCALGASTPLKQDPVIIEGVINIIGSMEQLSVQRFIYLSFLGVKESRENLGFFVNWIVAPLLRNVIADHEKKEKIIKQSQLNWTIIRPPRLTNGPYKGIYLFGEQVRPKSLILKISRADLADFMLRQLKDNSFIKKAPLVMY